MNDSPRVVILEEPTYGFASELYWSSSQSVARNAWSQLLTDGRQFDVDKLNTLRVRPVRAF
jgi:hypothetical protein